MIMSTHVIEKKLRCFVNLAPFPFRENTTGHVWVCTQPKIEISMASKQQTASISRCAHHASNATRQWQVTSRRIAAGDVTTHRCR